MFTHIEGSVPGQRNRISELFNLKGVPVQYYNFQITCMHTHTRGLSCTNQHCLLSLFSEGERKW